MNAAAQSVATFKKKISPSVIAQERGINLLALERPLKAPIHLYDLFGTINGVKQGNSAMGDWTAFKGRFVAVTPPDEHGQVREFTAGKTHIPVMSDMIFGTLDEARAANEGKPVSIEIALRISIVPANPNKPSMTGYEYDVQFLVQPRREEATDPIALLRKQAAVNQGAPALAAPSAAPAPEEKKGGKK